MPAAITYEQLHNAILAKIRDIAPALKKVTAYERLAERAAVPCAMVEFSDVTPEDAQGDIGTEQFAARLSFSVYVIGDPRREPAAKLAIRALACEIAAKLNRTHPGVPAGNILVKGCYPDFVSAGGYNANGQNAASFVEVQRIDAEVSALFNPSVWDWPTEDVEIIFEDGKPEAIAPEI